MTDTQIEAPPKFEQTMKGLLSLIQSLPRDGAVTNAVLVDWLLPLFEDARDEYHSLASENSDQIASVAEEVEAASAGDGPDEQSRQVVLALAGILSMSLQRMGWMDKNMVVTSKCPKDLADEFSKVQTFVQAWMNGVEIPVEEPAAGGEQ